ncbi:GNAT family protein [Amnibacterium sp. CER49]|uniref:GNAT family N-acetyltransferase n=1 Tax=Amnibacterium sp. CER49 TaxID=3039161 RepID=UPI00244C2CDD|nr:GNAT family protein [Amnibacterium sp. CER49]MDH2443770.1 GNAT family protein [Amnibacterium sp. CER49]
MNPSDGRVALRAWSRDDAPFMAEAFADPGIRRYNGPHDREGRPAAPLTPAGAEATIDRFTEDWQRFQASGTAAGVAFVVADAGSGAAAGCCGVDSWNDEDVAQIGYWIAPWARGRGFATRDVVLLTAWLFERGAARVVLTIVSGNEGSAAVARRAGYLYEGTMRSHAVWQGQRCDVLWFAALADEWREPFRRD